MYICLPPPLLIFGGCFLRRNSLMPLYRPICSSLSTQPSDWCTWLVDRLIWFFPQQLNLQRANCTWLVSKVSLSDSSPRPPRSPRPNHSAISWRHWRIKFLHPISGSEFPTWIVYMVLSAMQVYPVLSFIGKVPDNSERELNGELMHCLQVVPKNTPKAQRNLPKETPR